MNNPNDLLTTATESPISQRIQLSDFAKFKEYLIRQWNLTDRLNSFAKATPAQLYTIGAIAGIMPGQIAREVADFLNLPFLAEITREEIKRGVLSTSFSQARLVVPINHPSAPHAFALCNPFDLELVEMLRNQASPNFPLQIFLTEPDVIKALFSDTNLDRLPPGKMSEAVTGKDEEIYDFLAGAEPEGIVEIGTQPEFEIISQEEAEKIGQLPPIVRLVNLIVGNAVKAGASDIHIEPQELAVQVRYRIDGVLANTLKIPKHLHAPLVSRFKIIAHLDISEHRKPQDGRSRLRYEGRQIDLRISILPSQLGQKLVIRLLDNSASLINIDKLSFRPDIRQSFERMLSNSAGMILVTGPTGSGKSTTLYGALNWLKSPTKNIVTVENPVEYQISGITQVQIDVKAGMTFSAGLRSILRQDPDIILVGEIRDRETAAIAIEASQTGHLLLSTMHTNDAPTSITRLLDLEIEPFKITSSIHGILAQRLVRRLCSVCSVAYDPDAAMLKQIGLNVPLPEVGQWKTTVGCEACFDSGYKGRMAIHELLEVTVDIRRLINQQSPDDAIRDQARQNGMRTLLEDGIAKAALGLTTLEEVLRVAPRTEVHQTSARQSLPAQETPAAAVNNTAPSIASHSEVTPSQAESATNLLVLEDDVVTQSLLVRILEKSGYSVTTAGDGIDALLHLGRQRFDLIVSDINMPNLNGLQLLEIKNQKGVDVPVIFLTADDTEESEQKCLELGAVDYIKKPVNKDILLLRIQKALTKL